MKFKIIKDGVPISRQQAIELLDGITLYDPEGKYSHKSDMYMLHVLYYLKSRNLIDRYEVYGEAPPVPYKEGVIY